MKSYCLLLLERRWTSIPNIFCRCCLGRVSWKVFKCRIARRLSRGKENEPPSTGMTFVWPSCSALACGSRRFCFPSWWRTSAIAPSQVSKMRQMWRLWPRRVMLPRRLLPIGWAQGRSTNQFTATSIAERLEVLFGSWLSVCMSFSWEYFAIWLSKMAKTKLWGS